MPGLWLADILPVYGQIKGLVLLTLKCVKGFLVCSAGPRGLCGDPRIFDDRTKVPQVFRNPGGSPALQNKKRFFKRKARRTIRPPVAPLDFRCRLCSVALAVLDERAILQFRHCLPELLLGVHDDGSIPCHRLLDRPAGHQQEPYSFGPACTATSSPRSKSTSEWFPAS